MKVYTYLLFTLCFMLVSCKNENNAANNTANQQVEKVAEEDFNPLKRDKRLENLKKKAEGNSPSEIASMRQQALSIINHRLKNGEESYAIIEADVWEYEFYFKGEMSKPGEYKGVWIDFKPDNTYEYGHLKEVQGAGRFSYQFDRGELLMVDNNSNQKPQEWQVKAAGDALVLVGTHIYKDNAIQMKLGRVSDSIRQ